MNKAVFIHRSGPHFASYRYRAQIPAKAIGACVNGGEAGNVYIFSKPTPDDVVLAKECKAEGVKVVVDLGDDHFNSPVWGPVYLEMVNLADCLVTPTEQMASRIMKHTGKTPDVVIPDPYEEELVAPHAEGETNSKVKFVWFGHPLNLKDMRQFIKPVNFLEQVDLTFVTSQDPELGHPWVPWSLESQASELRKANVVMLPTRKGVEYKTANRLINALRAGCFPVCGGNIPSYHHFRKVAWVGHFIAGLQWVAQEKHLNELVAEGQKMTEEFSPENIGKQWQQVIDTLCV